MLMLNLSFPWFTQNTLLALAFLSANSPRESIKIMFARRAEHWGLGARRAKINFFVFHGIFDSCNGSGEKKELLVV